MKSASSMSWILVILLAANTAAFAEDHEMHEHNAGEHSGHMADMGHLSAFDQGMRSILAEYLKIQVALVGDQTAPIQSAATMIEMTVKKLDASTAPKGKAEHYEAIVDDLTKASQRIRSAGNIAEAREAFKELSKPVSMWASMAKPTGVSVMYCPMKKATWVQEGETVGNPYLGAEMASCGMKERGKEHSHDGGHSSSMHHEDQAHDMRM